jgi:DNA-binding CsgD family transcriptional regulator
LVLSLAGREGECAAIDGLLDEVRSGRSSVLVLRGEPGIGKTALLEYAVATAGPVDVTRIAGIESEMELAYAGLHQLLVPFLGGMESLPDPQRRALGAVFGLESGPRSDRFLVALATLTLLSDAAGIQPLLCVVDDAQWVDEESMATLSSVARRLRAEHLGMLIAVRDTSPKHVAVERLPTIDLVGLRADVARAIVTAALDQTARGQQAVADRIVAETRGNPLGLITLATGLTSDDLTADAILIDPLPISGRLEARYLEQTRTLPAATQTLLLTAAAEPTGDRDLLWRAGEILGFGPAEAEVVGLGQLVALGPHVEFRHPLMRSAIYYGATPADRRVVHGALAAVTDGLADADRRAWHRAASVDRHDEDVAAELERAANRVLHRGGVSAAAAFLSRAARLTPDVDRRASRLIDAAQAEWMAGSRSRAQRLVREAEPYITDAVTRARARRVEAAVVADRISGIATWHTVIAEARAATNDVGFVRATLLDGLSANLSHYSNIVELAQIGRTTPLPRGVEPGTADLLLDGICLAFGDGDEVAAAPLLRRAFTALDIGSGAKVDAQVLLRCASIAAAVIGDYDALDDVCLRLERLGRELGAPTLVYIGLTGGGCADLGRGSMSAALRRWSLDGEAIRDLLPPQMFCCDVLALALRGDESSTRSLEVEQARWTTEHDIVGFQSLLDWSLSVLEISLGNYQAAYKRAMRALPRTYLMREQVLLELVEAAARSGHEEEALSAVGQLERRAQLNRSPLFEGFVARARALAAGDERAEDLYRHAVDRSEAADASFHIGRSALLYGEWLRRQKRRIEAREQLRKAHALFVSMGAGAFAERARGELAATGETIPRRSVETARALTPQEDRIAHLAAEGDTNSEIATKLFLSAATIEYHLRKVFRKLDVTSRRELRRALVGHD